MNIQPYMINWWLIVFTFGAVWIRWCIVNSRWASLRSREWSKARKLHLLFNNISPYNLHSSIRPLDIYGPAINIDGSSPSNFRGSQHILNLADTCIVCWCFSSVISSLLPIPEPYSSIVLEFLCNYMPPCTSLLDSSI